MRYVCGLLLAIFLLPAAQAEVAPVEAGNVETSSAEVVKHIHDEVIVPGYARWHSANVALEQQARDFCAGKKNLKSLRTQWLVTHHAWLSVQPVITMPDDAIPPGLQVQFWPDKRNLLAKQVTDFIKTQPVNAKAQSLDLQVQPLDLLAQPLDLKMHSVALRSLSASEYLLFDSGHDMAVPEARAAFCPLLLANVAFQTAYTGQLYQKWQGEYSQTLLQIPNERYGTSAEVIADLLNADMAALALLLKKFGVPTGLPEGGAANIRLAEVYRAGDSVASLRTALAASKAVWDGKGLRSLVLDKDADLTEQIDQAFANTEKQLTDLASNLEQAMASAAGKQQLQLLYTGLKRLETLHTAEVSRVLGVQVGFNATDGD